MNRPMIPPNTPVPSVMMAPPTSQRSRPGGGGGTGGALAISCNRCRKPLNTTVFVCACDCAFCEECTYNHFNTSSNCPVCQRVLSEHDFMELVVADPSAAQSSTKTSHFQSLFTKQNAESRTLPFQDLCARMLKQHDDCRASTKFLMKQFLVETSKQGQRFQQILKAFETLKQEHTALKQAHNSQKMRYENAIETLQQQLASANKKMEEKDRQLYQFRKLHDQMTPESPNQQQQHQQHQHPRRVSSENAHSGTNVPESRQAPPMQGFMIQKEAQERARQRALEANQHRQPVLGNQRPSNPYSTPRSSGSQGSGSGGIRDLSSASGYAFASGAVVGVDLHGKRRRAMSPSQAFTMQPPGSYSVARGPSNYFQQQPLPPGGYSSGRH